jgi:hypothetical protein
MRVAIRRLARGDTATIPLRLGIQLVGAAYGQAPDSVLDWPADLYLDAVSSLPATTRG